VNFTNFKVACSEFSNTCYYEIGSASAGNVTANFVNGSVWGNSSGSEDILVLNLGTSQILFQNTAIIDAGANITFLYTTPGNNVIDGGGNTNGSGAAWTSGGTANTLGGGFFGSASTTGIAAATSNFALTTCGTGTPSTVTAASGATQSGQFTITNAGTPGTACTVTYTYPVAFPVIAPACRFTALGGTNPVTPTLTNGAISTTSAVVVLAASALTNTDTEIIGYNCSVPL
ncbi:MAG: hypothetical protein WB716_05850, partial [Candidatus Acidiferrales bacterium]